MGTVNAEVLARIQGLSLQAKFIAEGVLSGLHKSRHRGANVEFAEHKDYSPGDDIRYIDWRAYARRDKYSIKQYEEETHLRAVMAVDHSGSMKYGQKLKHAEVLAASLAYLLLHQRDAVGLATIAEQLSEYIPPRLETGHFQDIVQTLEKLQAQGKSDLGRALTTLAGRLQRRGLFILFSDFFDEQNTAITVLKSLRSRGHDVAVFHVLDRREVEFPFHDAIRFEDLEGPQALLVDTNSVRKAYLEEIQKFLERVRSECLGADIDYHLALTDEAPDEALLRFLHSRRA